jgi:uncharacterized protein
MKKSESIDFISEIRIFVENEFRKETCKYGYDLFFFHFMPVASCAEKLALELGGDREVIVIAAWLHDIGSVVCGRKRHHVSGAEIASKKLKELGYPPAKTELVKRCILNHRGSRRNCRESLEEKIVAEADILSNFEDITTVFKTAFVYKNLCQKDARDFVRKKLESKWKQLQFSDSKNVARVKYKAMIGSLG